MYGIDVTSDQITNRSVSYKTQKLMAATKIPDYVGQKHGLRTRNEGINQRNLKSWADVADKICFGRTYKFGIGI